MKIKETTTHTLDTHGIIVRTFIVDGKAAGGDIVSSNLKECCPYCSTLECRNECDGAAGNIDNIVTDEELESRVTFNDCMDTIESLILAHACAGIEVESPAYLEGLEIVIDTICNKFGA